MEYNTLDYYNKNAKQFYNKTLYGNLQKHYDKFLKHLPKGSYILDFGCGSGRDSKYFIENGYKVRSIDGSIEMCKLASKYIGQNVECIKFDELNDKNVYDGIWACSSILHVEKENLINIINKMLDAIKDYGVIFTSFRIGSGYKIEDGRYYNYLTKNELQEIVNRVDKDVKIIDYFETLPSVKGSKDNIVWGNYILKKYN